MIRIGILGDIGSGKSYVAKEFGYPVFNADIEVSKLYKKDKTIYKKLNKRLPKHIHSFPVDKKEISNAILTNKNNLKKIVKIVHLEIRKKLNILLENKINQRKDILIFIQSHKNDIYKRLKKRNNFNSKLLNLFKSIQYSLNYKKKKSKFIIKNNFMKKTVKKEIKIILKKIL